MVERLSFDAWGKRRFPNGADDPTGSITSQTTRGYTGHEELDAVSLVHMNGRVYDPLVGRMMSADPTVPDPLNAQAWNRYSYVGNDPLAFTDPSGFSWLSSFFHSIGNFFKHLFNAIPILRSIVQIVITAVLTPFVGPIAAAAAGAAIITGLSGGRLGDMLKAAALAAATTFAFSEVAGFSKALALAGDPGGAYAFDIVGRAGVGCLSSLVSGGSCHSGALAAGIPAAAAPMLSGLGYAPGLVANAVLGGAAAVAGGGKFENGAVTAAFAYLATEPMPSRQPSSVWGAEVDNALAMDEEQKTLSGKSLVVKMSPLEGASPPVKSFLEAFISGVADDVANKIGILRDATIDKGNFGLGSASWAASNELGESFVGPGYTTSSGGYLISADGLRQYRQPEWKPALGIYQSNFESRFKPSGSWINNGHLDIR